jgi:hypothetical protein
VLITSCQTKRLLGLFLIEMLYRHESPLSLTLRIGLQHSPPRTPQQPRNQGQGINKYEPKLTAAF